MTSLPAQPGLEISPGRMVVVIMRSLVQGMKHVRRAQSEPIGAIRVKSDKSLLTQTDEESERLLRQAATQLGIACYGEELGAADADRNPRYVLVIDPIDGTRPFTNRHSGGSTIIAYVYDKEECEIVVTLICCPGTGELWVAMGGSTYLYAYDAGLDKFLPGRQCQVWKFDSNVSRPTVYVDNPNAFTRRGVDMLRNTNLDVLDATLRRRELTKFAVGSNGLHHCLVASGGPVVGSITTSIGGIQDLGGILTVLNAGGKVAAFRLSDQRRLVPVDPQGDLLMPGGYDFVVMAIDDLRLAMLTDVLATALMSS